MQAPWTETRGELKSSGTDGWAFVKGDNHGIPVQEIKPLLRPLSSMTEEEMHECGNMVYDFSGTDLDQWQPSDFEIGLAPEQFHWLLKKGFDLFGLIDAGIALPKI